MYCRVSRRCALALTTALAAATIAANAATDVTVRITDRQGQVLPDVAVALTLVESDAPRPAWSRYHGALPPRTTGLDGQATFPGLGPGVYTTSISGLTDEFLISPASPTSDAVQGRFTVRDEAHLTVPIVLNRGDQVTVELLSDIPDDPVYELSFVEVVTGARVGTRLYKATRAKVLLPVGRWRVEFKPPRGLVFLALEIDGVTAPLATATLEIAEGGRQRFVTLRFSGPCFIRAHVSTSGGSGYPPGILATQIAPGPLTSAATAVGAPPLSPAGIPEDDSTPYFHGWLPDGVWRIAPTSDALESSDPPFIDVDCTSTPQHALEFTTRMRDGDDAAREDRLVVTVVDPNDNEMDGAFVEVYSPEAIDGGAEPLARLRTSVDFPHARPRATFTGLPRKPLLVVAGHQNWIDASVVVPFDPKQQNPRYRTAEVRLVAGATIEVDVLKPGDAPAANAWLRLDRQAPTRSESAAKAGARTSPRVRDEALRELKAHRVARTDVTGRARISGIEPGRYVAKGAYTETGEESYTVLVRDAAHEPADLLALQFEGSEHTRVTIVLRAAASIVADLVCDDGGAVPIKVDARLLAPELEAAWRTTLPVGELVNPLFKLDACPLGGASTNRLRLGPLKPGVYGLAIRPRGFDRWTFAGAGDDPSRATSVQVQEGQEADLGVWTIPCRPSILLLARPIGDVTALPATDPRRQPDVSHAAVTSTIAASEVRVDRESADRRRYGAPEILPLLRSMRLYGVASEPVKVSLQVHDRFLLPEPVSPLPNPLTLDLERGREEVVPLQFDALAGSMDIAVDAPAARAIFADGTITPIVRDEAAGLLRAGPLRPGVYSVEVCVDPACSRVMRRFDGVTVTALSVAALPPGK
jgi:hypothetical protein